MGSSSSPGDGAVAPHVVVLIDDLLVLYLVRQLLTSGRNSQRTCASAHLAVLLTVSCECLRPTVVTLIDAT